jgi:hypothetical protein
MTYSCKLWRYRLKEIEQKKKYQVKYIKYTILKENKEVNNNGEVI